MAEALKALKLKRGSLKSSLTRLCTYLDSNKDAINLAQLQERQIKLKELFGQFDEVQNQIEFSEGCVIQEEERDQFENTYFELLGRIKTILENNDKGSTSSGGISNQNTSMFHQNTIKLPTIELPSFSGNYDQWFPFFDTFNSLIHLNADISQVHKFQYLKSCLKGDAASIIHSLEISESNYDDAWKRLVDRYDNKRLIVHKHIHAMHEIPPSPRENHTSLRTLLDGFLKHVRALTALKRPTKHWDDLLNYLVMSKLDYSTKKEWDAQTSLTEFPSFNDLTDFLTRKCNTLETTSKTSSNNPTSNTKILPPKRITSYLVTNNFKCSYCGENHRIYRCEKFLENTVNQRIQHVKVKKLCYNCLQANHSATQCNSGACKTCNKKHHTLLHLERDMPPSLKNCQTPSTSISNHSAVFHISTHVLLSTAVVKIYDNNGRTHKCRVLLDSGSQSNLITLGLAEKLSLPQKSTSISISGINQSMSHVTNSIRAKLKSIHSNFHTEVECLILDTISERLPLISFTKEEVAIPKNLKLADPDFNVSGSIDMLIGTELFFKLLCVGRIELGQNQPLLQKTLLGWILSGKVTPNLPSTSHTLCNLSTMERIDKGLTKFWEIENLNRSTILSPDERFCEDCFQKTYTRNSEGRFVVRFPMKQDVPTLGDSRESALKRFYSLEKRLNKQPSLKTEYSKFMKEYIDLGHMRKLHKEELSPATTPQFYLPHHAVVKESSITTRVRVVFDGSAKSSSGHSLNDTLIVGPKLQQDLFEIVSRFRTHQVVLTADIAKMYRQVLMDPSQTSLQRILWREDSRQELETFELTTVTYGTASASYLAIKSLQQLATEEQENYPVGAKIILRDFYVDDMLTGARTVDKAREIQRQVIEVLRKGGFELRKWGSNNPSLLENLSSSPSSPIQHEIVNLDKNEGISTLGLQWNPKHDLLQYCVNVQRQGKRITKRSILSAVSQIFDPLGLISPVIIMAKIFIQQLWQLGLDWDESLPITLQDQWINYEREYQDINLIKIPRNVLRTCDPKAIELHGFCDASEKAYGACVYIRVTDDIGNVTCTLLCSKTRVTPLKVISLPRLELCGALLLAYLMDQMTISIELDFTRTIYWTDSTVVLSWLKSCSKTWKTFVANRVSEIQDLTKISDWHHVGTADNPADILSRGCSPLILKESTLWWEGPKWLQRDSLYWPNHSEGATLSEDTPERKIVNVATSAAPENLEWFLRYSDLSRLLRITAYCQRFKNNSLAHVSNRDVETGRLTIDNLRSATNTLIKVVQSQVFSEDLVCLKTHGQLNRRSRLLSLNPFVDDNGILRVGGRLRHSNISYDKKHQILLPAKHPFTELVIRHEHVKQLHAGTQTTIATLRNAYWILSSRNSVKAVIRRCITCFRAKPTGTQQIMGDLPANRVTQSRPFEVVGVDYFGPLYVKEGRRRNSAIGKTYGAVFICFTTKALHLELVGNLSTDSFLAALKRFISRRGRPTQIYSDNGTQFVGAKRELMELRQLFSEEDFQDKVRDLSASEGINWHFSPARSPHFGGIWEAAVKSTKHHLTRVTGKTSLNYEEITTLLTQIEAIVNSRPITPMSNDPNDLAFLTPAHFLIGDSLLAIPEPNLSHLKLNSMSRWQYVQQIREHFWRRWSREYLSQLQSRNRWKSSHGQQLEIGKLVLVRDENSPPLHWMVGRIQEVFPGEDGIVRVADVRTSKGTYRRAAAKLCPLPSE